MNLVDLGFGIGIELDEDEDEQEAMERVQETFKEIADKIHERVCTEDTPGKCTDMLAAHMKYAIAAISHKMPIDDIAEGIIKVDFVFRLAANARYN